MTQMLLEVHNLIKDFGSFRAVDNVSFSIPKGKVVGLLGPNGAGKTTTIRILLDVTTPTSGSISYFGKDFITHKTEILQKINYISAYNTLLSRTTVWENLLIYATLYQVRHPKEKMRELLGYFEAMDLKNKIYEDLSAGQKTRINIIKSLLNDPELLLMDEPTAALDPDIADKTLTLIERWKKENNLSILYTSHNMQEVTRICDDVIFLIHGKIIEKDTPINLANKASKASLSIVYDKDITPALDYLRNHNYKFEKHPHNNLTIATDEKDIPKLIFNLSKTGLWMSDISITKPTLEDYFLQISRKKTL